MPRGIIEVKKSADHFAGRIGSRNRQHIHVETLTGFRVDVQATERECDAAGDVESFERRRIEPMRPIRFLGLDADSAVSILYCVIERHVGFYGGVEFAHRLQEAIRIYAFEF